MTQQPTAAGALYPHLQSGIPERRSQRREAQSVAAAMYPSLPKLKPPPHPLLPRLKRAGER